MFARSSRPYREAARYYRARPPYSFELRPRLSAVLGWDGTGRLLDIGCGPGVIALELASSFAEVIGLDPEEEMLAEAQKLTPESERGKVRWVQGRAEDIPALGLGRFNAVTLAQSFHWTDREAVAEVVYEILVPGGAMILIHHEASRGLEPSSPVPQVRRPPHPPIPHALIDDALVRYLGRGKSPPDPGRERYEVFLARTRFGAPERLLLPGRTDLVRTVDDVIDAYLATSFAAPDLFGDRLDDFRAELADALRQHTNTGLFWEWPGNTEVLIARKRSA